MNQANIRKHGIDFRQAAYVFSDPFALSIPDDEHSENEECWLLLGKSLSEQILLVVHAIRTTTPYASFPHARRPTVKKRPI